MGETNPITPTKEVINPIAITPEGTTGVAAVESDDIGTDAYDIKNAELAAYIMYSPRSTAIKLPKLRTKAWPYKGLCPNPISISKARQILATAYATVPCEVAGAGVHGHTWIVETDMVWKLRNGLRQL